MPRINLLPTKATWQGKRVKKELAIGIGLAAIVLIGLSLFHGNLIAQEEALLDDINVLKQSLLSLQADSRRVEDFEDKAKLLEQKLKVIDELQVTKHGPSHLLYELTKTLDRLKRVWLTEVDIGAAGILKLRGGAMETEDVSDFQRDIKAKSDLFYDLKLHSVDAQKTKDVSFLKWEISTRVRYGDN
ncbi:MAG: PilN domain-containing protein [Myxococcota bacterium]|nr:PilN domain-containing protein [Myxococcota bacterium]